MAIKATAKKPLFGNRRSHALNATRHAQKLNLQNVTLEDGTKIKVTAREAKKYKKNTKLNEELNENEVVQIQSIVTSELDVKSDELHIRTI